MAFKARLLQSYTAHRIIRSRRLYDTAQHDNNAGLDDNDLSHVLTKMLNGMNCRQVKPEPYLFAWRVI